MMTANNGKDYINRYAVLNVINDAIEHNALSYDGCVNEIVEFIAKIPAAEVRPVKRGKWERASRSLMACSSCGNCVVDDRISGLFFCPNCGADMRNAED